MNGIPTLAGSDPGVSAALGRRTAHPGRPVTEGLRHSRRLAEAALKNAKRCILFAGAGSYKVPPRWGAGPDKVATGEFSSAEEFTREAVRVYHALETQHAELRAEIQQRIEQADRGETGPLDIESIKAEGRRRLAEKSGLDYRPNSDGIELLLVAHGSRDTAGLLRRRVAPPETAGS